MKRKEIGKKANRMCSLLLALTLCTAAPVSGGAAVYAAGADDGENLNGVTVLETAGGVDAEEGQNLSYEVVEKAETEANASETTSQESDGELQGGNVPAGDSIEKPIEELAEAASMEASLQETAVLAAATTDWIDYADSTWTVDQPIMDAADLAQMAVLGKTQTFAGKTITLGADIDLSAHLWTPIGNDTYKFAGVFDGGNYQITGLDTGERDVSAGLFGTMLGSATIRNLRLTVERVYMVTSSIAAAGAGGLVGKIGAGSGGTIYNCQIIVNGTVYAKGYNATNTKIWAAAGGMVGVGESSILIDNCFVNVKPGAVIENEALGTGNAHAGGFVGNSNGTETIQNSKCIMEGTIQSTAENVNRAASVGGFIGWTVGAQIENCYGIVTSTAKFVASNTNKRPSIAAPFLGFAQGTNIRVSNAYSIDLGASCELTGAPNRGAILGCGLTSPNIKLENCYYYTGAAVPAYNGTAAASNMVEVSALEEMKKESTYTTFDFVDNWTIVPELNDGYPVLQMELTDQQKTDIVTALVSAEKSFIVASGTDEAVKLAAVQGYVDGLVSGSLFAKAGGTAVAVKAGSAYQITFRLGTVSVQKTVAASFVQSSQTKDAMMAEAVGTIPQTAEIVVAEDATQLQKKTAVESYIRGLLNPLDFTKANGTFTVSLTSGTTYSVALSLAEVTGQTVSITVNFVNGVQETAVTLTTDGTLLTMFNGTAGYGKNNMLFEVNVALETGKKLVYAENGTERPIYWSPILENYVGFTSQGELSKAELVGNIRIVSGTPETIRYGIIGTGRANRSKIGFPDLYYFDKTVLVDDAIPEGDVERVLAMDVNGDFNLSVSDLMSIIEKYVFNTEFSKATR